MNDTPRDAPDPAKLQASLVRLLRPLVRLFIRSGITFPALVEMMRELYVNVAEYDFALPNKDQTDSRVSLLTGVHRKEVRRLRGAGAPVSVAPASLSRTSRIIARWLAAPEYTDGEGKPAPLPRTHETGPSFERLVESVTRDVRSRAVLDEWLDRRLASMDDQGRVVLLEAAYVPQGDEAQLYYFGRNLHDHIAAAVWNVMGNSPRFFERAVHYDGLTLEAARKLEVRARELAMKSLQTANRLADEATKAEAAKATPAEEEGGDDWRWNFGTYIYIERKTGPLGSPEDGA